MSHESNLDAHLGADFPAASPRAAPIPEVLERGKRLSQSILWRYQRAYFERRGVKAWSCGEVPHFITSNPFVAATYARLIAAHLRDLRAEGKTGGAAAREHLGRREPVYIVEIGSGAGRFAYNLLRQLDEAMCDAGVSDIPVTLVLTDVAEENLDFWRSHPGFANYFESGRLDLARFDAEGDTMIRLERGGTTLSLGSPSSPWILIANYVFDGLTQDAFRLIEGRLYESLVTVSAPPRRPGSDEVLDLAQIALSFEHRAADETYYDDAEFNAILASYCRTLSNATLTIPLGALKLLRAVASPSSRPVLLLSSDRGFHQRVELLGRSDPKPAYHGSFSLEVNYDALGDYVQRRGGTVMHPEHGCSDLVVAAYRFGCSGKSGFLRRAYAHVAEGFGPHEFFAMKRRFFEGIADAGLSEFLAIFRLAGFDGQLVLDAFQQLRGWLGSASKAMCADAAAALHRAWEGYLSIGEERNLAIHLALLFRAMGREAETIAYCLRSRTEHGPTQLEALTRGQAHLSLCEYAEAVAAADEALELAPWLKDARALRAQAAQEMERRAVHLVETENR